MPRFCNLLILLYTFSFEKKYFNINWFSVLFRIVCSNQLRLKNDQYLEKNLVQLFNNKINLSSRLYVALNSDDLIYSVGKFNMVCDNLIMCRVVNQIIYGVTKIKKRLFGLTYI